MQEEFGGEEKVVAAEHEVVAEKKRSSKRRERKIPTVEAVVAAETADDSKEAELFSQKEEDGESVEISAENDSLVERSAEMEANGIESDKSSGYAVSENIEAVYTDFSDQVMTEERGREASENSGVLADGGIPEEKESEDESVEKIPLEIERAVDEVVALSAEKESGHDFTGADLDFEMALVEAVLFLECEPQSSETLGKITKLSEAVVDECIERLKFKYTNVDCGIEITQILGGWILTPKRECFEAVKERYGKKNEGKLSKAAIETLSIIAYSQPITRAEIESIRHVNVDNMMRILLDRKFIKETGKKDIPGKPVTYGTTDEFLEFFHLQSIAELPQLDDKENERFQLAR